VALKFAAENKSDPDREAPPVGGDGSDEASGAGKVGGILRGARLLQSEAQLAPAEQADVQSGGVQYGSKAS
jgi:hypothetical protein